MLNRSGLGLLFAAGAIGLSLAAHGAATMPAYDFDKSRIKTIYIVPSAHWDRGWYLPVDDEEKLYKQHLDRVIEACKKSPEFRWMIETTWTVEAWLKQTPDPQERQALLDLVRQGRIGLPGNYMVDGGGLFRPEEANRLCYSARSLRDTYQVPINTAMLSDNPGSSWALPQVFARSEIRYYLAGPNFSFGGSLGIPKNEMPFYWQGPDGSKVLTWVCKSYGEANDFYGLSPNLLRFFSKADSPVRTMTDMQIMESMMGKMLGEFDAAGYPYDAVMTVSSGDYDDPSHALYMLNYLAAWRKAHRSPELKLALPEEFFRYIEGKYADRIPTHSGDWSFSGPGASPAITAWDRWTGDHLPVLEKISSINRLVDREPSLSMGGTKYARPYPADEITSAYQTLLKANGHGGGPGTGWAGLNTKRELEHCNEVHVNNMRQAYEKTSYLLDQEFQSLAHMVQSDGPGIVVANPMSWERADVVRVHVRADQLAKGFRLEDAATSETVAYQKTGSTQIEFLASDVPSLGYRLYRMNPAASSEPSSPTLTASGSTVESRFYKVSVNPEGDIVSIFDKEQKRDLVSPRSKYQFNRMTRSDFQDAFMGRNVYEAVPTGSVSIKAVPGSVSSKLVITREASPHVMTEIVLYDNVKRIDLLHVVDRERLNDLVGMPGYKDHSQYFFPFPFDLAPSRLKVGIESTNGFLSPTESFLPGVVIGPFCSQHEVILRDGKTALIVANRQASSVQFGDIGGFAKEFAPSEPTLLSRILMNSHLAQTKDEGEVILPNIEPGTDRMLRFEYSLTCAKSSVDAVAATRFGADFGVPLLATAVQKQTGPLAEPALSFFAIDAPNVVLLDLKRPDFGDKSGYILRLQEIGGAKRTKVTVHSAFPIKRAERDNLVEQALDAYSGGRMRVSDLPVNPLEVSVGKYETVTVRVGF